MQPMKYQKQISLSLVFAFAALSVTPSASAFPCDTKTLKKIAGGAVLVTAITCFFRLVTKKTQPKRVYPKDDSFSEIGWYVFDELLTGQMEKGDRASRVVIDPENPSELKIEYSKVEARGVTGIIYSTMKPAILPTLVFMTLFNKEFIAKVREGIIDIRKFLDNPSTPIDSITDAITGDLAKLTAPQTQQASAKNS